MASRIVSIVEIARAVFSRIRPLGFMAVLSSYLDASGSVTDPRCQIFAMAGYVATGEQWESFEREWQHVLDDAGVTHLHMKHFAHSNKEFAEWKGDEKRRVQFMQRLTKIVRDNDLEDFSVALNMDDYRHFDKHFKLSESIGAYAMIASAVMGKIEKWHARYRPSDSLLFFLEKGDAEQDSLRKLAERTQAEPDANFIPKKYKQNGIDRYCLPMQASDLLAYEHAKCLTDMLTTGKRKSRKSLFQLSSQGVEPIPQSWVYLDANFLRLTCEFFKVSKRR